MLNEVPPRQTDRHLYQCFGILLSVPSVNILYLPPYEYSSEVRDCEFWRSSKICSLRCRRPLNQTCLHIFGLPMTEVQMYVCVYKLHQEVHFLYEYLMETGTATTLTYISLGLSQHRHVNTWRIPKITPWQILPHSSLFLVTSLQLDNVEWGLPLATSKKP